MVEGLKHYVQQARLKSTLLFEKGMKPLTEGLSPDADGYVSGEDAIDVAVKEVHTRKDNQTVLP